ncbi:hypothetical protein K2173_015572 [Erythroxylum novogranatense]|uniref:Uncharacterized protein n=1 Tax=Erythroxylum novogranatense TaxID=1862640 RepID=A0AAV8SE22_9ROSI|nr:hypothetical protein K2173_015572 [Erythroxylum novogranatense]
MASISNESIKSNCSHITPRDFKNAPKLPDSHTWTFSPESLDLYHTNALAMIGKVSEDWGMFQVINHGIPDSFLREVEQAAKFLFSLPANQKLLAARSPGVACILAFFAKKMWHEGLTIRVSPLKNVIQLWPDDHEDYEQEMLYQKIIGLMTESLGLTQQDVKWFKPKSEGNEPLPHILQLDFLSTAAPMASKFIKKTVGGVLYIHTHAVVVNAGDMMHIISGGSFKNPPHQAVVKRNHHRISIAYFYTPPKDIKVSPPTKLIDSNHPLLYRPVTWKEYLDEKAAELTNALEHVTPVVVVSVLK